MSGGAKVNQISENDDPQYYDWSSSAEWVPNEFSQNENVCQIRDESFSEYFWDNEFSENDKIFDYFSKNDDSFCDTEVSHIFFWF